MAEPVITIPYDEMEGSPAPEQFDEGGVFTAVRRLRCAWADRLTLAAELKGSPTQLPHAYPHLTAARCRSIAIAPHDEGRPLDTAGDTTKASYTEAILTVNYSTAFGAGASGGGTDGAVVIVEESVEPWAEFLTISPVGLHWGSTTGPSLTNEEAPGKLFRGLNWVYTRYFLSSVPPETLTLVGKVNNASITSLTLGLTFAAQTLLYNPPLFRRQFNSDGTSSITLTYRFSCRPDGWNRFWRGDTQTWTQIYSSTGPADPYQTGNFLPLVG